MWSKWNNHFSEMKEDVGMSPHEKEGEQEGTYTKRETYNPIPTSLFLFDMYVLYLYVDEDTVGTINNLLTKGMFTQRCRDRVSV